MSVPLPLNKVVCGDCVEVMRTWPAESIDLVVTSPPYWGLRDYGAETIRIWGGDPECEHEWIEDDTKFRYRGNEGLPKYIRTDTGKPTGGGKKHPQIKNDLEMTNPREFCFECGAWRGSLGLEPHPQMFIDHLVEIFSEVKRVLKPTGTFWLNLGDTYFTGAGKSRNPGGDSKRGIDKVQPASSPNRTAVQDGAWLQPKQKLMMPSRVAIALQHDGWILRNDIIWDKPNHMPSSVKDRLTNAYEHVFLFAKARRYYFDLDAIRQPHASSSIDRVRQILEGQHGGEKERAYVDENIIPAGGNMKQISKILKRLKKNVEIGKGKNPGDVWRVPTTPFKGAHFATFPSKLIEPIIKAGSPTWICSKCGKPRKRITEPTPEYAEKLGKSVHDHKDDLKRGMRYDKVLNAEYETVGWSDCGCGEKWVGGVVMDPFGGTGTVGQVARRLGRRFIIIEINPEYARIAEQRVRGKYRPRPEGVSPLTQFSQDPPSHL